MAKVQLGLPKGSLQDSTVEMFEKAGWNIKISSRSYYPSIDDPELECTLIRTCAASSSVRRKWPVTSMKAFWIVA